MDHKPFYAGTITGHFLNNLKPFFGEKENTNLEYSWVLRPGAIEKEGRLSCWIQGDAAKDFVSVADAIIHLNAPEAVRQAQASVARPFIQGIGLSASAGKSQYRLYLHSRHPQTQKQVYEAWRWGANEAATKSVYTFRYAGPAPGEPSPAAMIPALLLPAFEQLVAQPQFRQLSGYWLRSGEEGLTDQVDLCFPWLPDSGTVPGFTTLLEALGIDPASYPGLLQFPLRHIAFKTGSNLISVTLYTSAPGYPFWPDTEQALQRHVAAAAGASGAPMQERYFANLPLLPDESGNSNEIGRFYDGPLDAWRQILGESMHYHHGLFRQDAAPTDEAMEEALNEAVTRLYPLLPKEGRIYDIGCGWGGPLGMIAKDTGCSVLGITPSVVQYRYLSSLGYDVRLGNAEYTLPPGYFDAVLMLESLCHIADKERLLTVLRRFSGRLVMRVNCQDFSPPGTAFAGSMHMISSATLQQLLEKTGWQIRHWKNVRQEALLSAAVWSRRQQAVPPADDTHIEALRSWTAHVLNDPVAWGQNNPLIEVMAE